MSYAKSFYADQKPVERETTGDKTPTGVPSNIPTIAEDALSPTQIQEAIRLYRSVISNSAPQSPANYKGRTAAGQPRVEVAARPVVHSNYYGGGPTDIPQSYLLNYNPKKAENSSQGAVVVEQQQNEFEQQLTQRLENLTISQQQQQPVVQQQEYVAPPKKAQVVRKSAPIAQKAYDDEESNYCFNKKEKEEEAAAAAAAGGGESESDQIVEIAPPVYTSAPVPKYEQAPVEYKYNGQCSASDYIGMSNDSRFIYDAKGSIPASYQINGPSSRNVGATYRVVNQPQQQEGHEEHGTTTTEDVTQKPMPSPAPHSRFRGLIRNVNHNDHNIQSEQLNSPIVVEKMAEPSAYQQQHQHYNHYDAFAPINQMPTESEYQLPVLNDLASCIENY